MKESWIELSMYFGGFLIACAIAYGGFHLYRWFNFKYAYEDKVIEVIHKTVKKECLQ